MSQGVLTNNRKNSKEPGREVHVANIDMNQITAIVREVIRRLRSETNPCADGQVISDRVVTARTIEQIGSSQKVVVVREGAVITPAAKDVARELGIDIVCGSITDKPETEPNHTTTNGTCLLTDPDDPQRGAAVATQLKKRNVNLRGTRIVLTDSPAAMVVAEVRRGEVAVMISSLAEVDRFARECSPTVWVLDMKRLNLPAAVNVAAAIAKQKTT